MIITIARECGAGGEVIGKLLSEKFNIPFYSWQTLVEMEMCIRDRCLITEIR